MFSKASTHLSRVSGAYAIHETHHHYPTIAYVPVYPAAAYYITTPNLPDNFSPQVFHSTPYNTPSPLSALTFVNLPTPSRRNSPSPTVTPVQAPTTLGIDPLVATGTGPYPSSKLRYDLAEGPHTACISTHGINTPIGERSDRLVVVGALPNTVFHLRFNHPHLTETMVKCDSSSLTIGELIELLHSHFHQGLDEREELSLKSDINFYPAAVKNQLKRCKAPGARDRWDKGMKRIDVLGRTRKFRGVQLYADPSRDDLILYVEFEK